MAKYIECEAAYRFAQDQLKKETGAYSNGWNHAMNVMKGALHNNDALPAADVVPVRHGQWIEKRWSTEDDWGVINWHSLTCSVCKHEERTNGLSSNSIYKYDYCPWCGAKMDGE